MKRILILILCVALSHTTFAQGGNAGNTRFSVGLSLDMLDQFTPDIDGFQSFKQPMDLGLRAFTWINVNSSLAVEVGVGTNGLRTQKIESPLTPKNLHMFNIDGGLVYKFNNGYILKESFPVAPYLSVKARGSLIEDKKALNAGSKWGFGIPIGGGINWGFKEGVALQTGVHYTFGITDNFDNDLIWNLGVLFDLGLPDKEPVIVEPVVVDTDGDGIADDMDDCPQVAGLAAFKGCPDTDGDGVADAQDDCPQVAGVAALAGCPDADGDGVADAKDKCPQVVGVAKFNGCPDTDGDGIADADDKCPKEAGIAALQGCPIQDADGDGVADADDKCPKVPGVKALNGCPDADGDGVADADDKCPSKAGTAANKGCPEIKAEVIERLKLVAQDIDFETGSATIKTKSFVILDEVVQILNQHPDYYVSVSGHTDNVGNANSNLILSQKRAKAAADYLISKGINPSRVSSAGYGETQPIADNGTAAGRAKNRRVSFNLFIP